MKKLKPANQNPDFGKVCIHGSLKRQCYTCGLEESNDWLKKVNQDLRDEIDRMNKAIEVCAKHWELVAGSSAFRLSGMARLLKDAMTMKPEDRPILNGNKLVQVFDEPE